MLYCTSLVAYVGAAEHPALTPRRLTVMNTATDAPIQHLSFVSGRGLKDGRGTQPRFGTLGGACMGGAYMGAYIGASTPAADSLQAGLAHELAGPCSLAQPLGRRS